MRWYKLEIRRFKIHPMEGVHIFNASQQQRKALYLGPEKERECSQPASKKKKKICSFKNISATKKTG